MRSKITIFLLACGIVSSALYIGTDILASTLYPGYSYTAQQVSELSAIGAPTRSLWIAMLRPYMPLVVAFGIGVWLAAGSKRSVRVTAVLLIVFAIIGIFWPPMHQRGTIGSPTASLTDTLHIVFAGVQVLLMAFFIAFGSGVHGKGFRIYSILTIAAMLVCGAIVGTQVSAIAAGRPTPWMGLVERVSVYSPLLWVVALAAILLQSHRGIESTKTIRC
jgi:Protein of unknown function (DUF998)